MTLALKRADREELQEMLLNFLKRVNERFGDTAEGDEVVHLETFLIPLMQTHSGD